MFKNGLYLKQKSYQKVKLKLTIHHLNLLNESRKIKHQNLYVKTSKLFFKNKQIKIINKMYQNK